MVLLIIQVWTSPDNGLILRLVRIKTCFLAGLVLLCARPAFCSGPVRHDLFVGGPPVEDFGYGCLKSKLDLVCGPGSSRRWIEFKPLAPRFERNAVTIRFGGSTKGSPSKLEFQLGRWGNWANSALFIAAIVATFLL
jgi:hypothetical protein